MAGREQDVWRTTGDIQATWGSIMNNLDKNNNMAPVNHANPGQYVRSWIFRNLGLKCQIRGRQWDTPPVCLPAVSA